MLISVDLGIGSGHWPSSACLWSVIRHPIAWQPARGGNGGQPTGLRWPFVRTPDTSFMRGSPVIAEDVIVRMFYLAGDEGPGDSRGQHPGGEGEGGSCRESCQVEGCDTIPEPIAFWQSKWLFFELVAQSICSSWAWGTRLIQNLRTAAPSIFNKCFDTI